MNQGKLVFAQISRHLPLTTFRRCVARYGKHHKVKTFSCLNRYLCVRSIALSRYSARYRSVPCAPTGTSSITWVSLRVNF